METQMVRATEGDTASDLDNPWQRAPLAHPSEERRRTCVETKRIFCATGRSTTTTRAARLLVDLNVDLVISSYQQLSRHASMTKSKR